jgi:hypothetical protein
MLGVLQAELGLRRGYGLRKFLTCTFRRIASPFFARKSQMSLSSGVRYWKLANGVTRDSRSVDSLPLWSF